MSERIIGAYHGNPGTVTEMYFLSEFAKVDSVVRCMVTTLAFGMGVDIADITVVVHWGISKSILSHWQEVGRCARNGTQGYTYMLATLRTRMS